MSLSLCIFSTPARRFRAAAVIALGLALACGGGGGGKAEDKPAVAKAAIPALESIAPLEGPPGTRIALKGAHLGGATKILFGTLETTPDKVQDTLIEVVVPAEAKTGPVTVVTPLGQPQSKSAFKVIHPAPPAPQPSPQPAPQPNPQPAPQPNPQPAPQPNPQPAPQPNPQPAPQPNPQPAPQPNPQPAPQPNPQPAPQPNPQPAPQPNPQPAPQSNPQPNPGPSVLAGSIIGPGFLTENGADYGASITLPASSTCVWEVENGIATSALTSSDLTFTAGASGTTILRCTVTDAHGRLQVVTPLRSTIVPAPAVPLITAPAEVVGLQTGYTASVPPQAGCTYIWSAGNATLTAGESEATVTFTPGDAMDMTLHCRVTNQAGLSESRMIQRVLSPAARCTDTAFLPNGRPYLQLGVHAPVSSMAVVWMTPGNHDADWRVDVRGATEWEYRGHPDHVLVNVPGEPVHRVYTQDIQGLTPGAVFYYRIRIGSNVVFQNRGKALMAPGQSQRVAVVGDLVSNIPANPRLMADRLLTENPDLVVVPGDIVNREGHANQYRDSLFSAWNANDQGPAQGAPLMRAVPTAMCLGNNDTDRVGERGGPIPRPNGLAYYYYFAMPLNGPPLGLNNLPAGDNYRHALSPWLNPAATFAPFLAAAQDRYLRMGNYSFDSGNIHWVVLDSCRYMNYWQDGALRTWLRADLAGATATWKFVVFHHPVFSHHGSTAFPYPDKWMRQIWPILEAGGVDMTFSGHLHSYQRARPLRFAPYTGPLAGERAWFYNDTNKVEDFAFTGTAPNTRAHGIIPIITGAGGAHFHRMAPPDAPLDPVAEKFIPGRLSYSLMDVSPTEVEFRQMVLNSGTNQWEEGDHFHLTK